VCGCGRKPGPLSSEPVGLEKDQDDSSCG
jgi:hypothetical protein